MSSPKRSNWGDNSRARPSTEAYRDGLDKICGDNDKKRAKKQDKLAADARLSKARACVKVYGEDASDEAKDIVKKNGIK